MFLHVLYSAYPQIEQNGTFMNRRVHNPLLIKHEEEGDDKGLWLLLSLPLLITDPYRIVNMSEEAQMGRVPMDLTKTTELFQTGQRGSCSTVSKSGVCECTYYQVYTYGHVSYLFLLAKWILLTICVTGSLYPEIRRP